LVANVGYISRYIREHYVRRNIRRDLYERFIEWCGERSINICLEKALSILTPNIAPNIGANITPNTKVRRPEPVVSPSGSYKWCRPRSSITNLESFVKRVEKTLGLEDWWEDDDRVCFKTKLKPSKI
jgi:hypothetical protein